MIADLTSKRTLPELVAVYNEACAEIRASYAKIDHVKSKLEEAFISGSFSIRHRHTAVSFDPSDADDAIMEIRHSVWAAIIERTEIKRFLSVRRWEELDRQVRERKMPEVTVESIVQLMSSFTTQFAELLGEAIEEVFDWLRPRHSEHKTNNELEVPHKAILTYMVSRTFGWRVNYHKEQRLTALENVFSALDGKGQVTKSYRSEIENVVSKEGFNGTGETQYFRFKVFGNGNMHLEFKRLDLLDKFNKIAGGRRLRPAENAAAAE